MNKLMKILKLSFMITISLINSTVFGASETIGNSLSSYFQSHHIFSGFNNKINHAAIMDNGIAFEDENTTCSYDSIYYINSAVSLNEGRLFLNKNLVLKKNSQLPHTGKIYGNNHYLQFPHINSTLDLPTLALGIPKQLTTPVDLGSAIESCAWSYDDKYVAFGEKDDVYIQYFNETDQTLTTTRPEEDFMGNIVEIHWRPNDYHLAIGIYKNNNSISIYKLNVSNGTFTQIDSYNAKYTVSMKWNRDGSYIAFLSKTEPYLQIYPFDGSSIGTPITAVLTHYPWNEGILVSWRGDSNYLATGNESKIYIHSFNGTTLSENYTQEFANAITTLDWSPTTSLIAVGFDNNTLHLYEHNATAETLTEKDSITLSNAIHEISWSKDGNLLGFSNHTDSKKYQIYHLNLTTTTLTYFGKYVTTGNGKRLKFSHDNRYLAIGDAGGYVEIVNFESTPFLFDNINLIFNSDINFKQKVQFDGNSTIEANKHLITFETTTPIDVLQDSSLTLKNARIFIDNYSTIDVNSSNATLTLENVSLDIPNGLNITNNPTYIEGKTDLSGTFSFPMIFNENSHTNLFKDSTLHNSWLFTSSTFLNGNGKILDLASTGSIIVDHNSTLHLSNITLKGVRNGLLILNNDASKIYMSNVNIELDEVVTITIGGIYVNGPSTFILKNYDWTFDQNASLTVDGVVLWKDPIGIESNEGDIKFGSGEQSNYLSLISSGTIKTATDTSSQLDSADLQNQITNNSSAIETYQSNISSLQTDITQNSNAVITNKNTISSYQTDITQNSNAIVTNQSDISSLQTDITQNSNAIITNKNNIDSNQTSITQNSNAIATNQSDISSLQNDIAQNSNAVITNKNDIDNIPTEIAQNSNAIITNKNNLDTTNSNVSALQEDVIENSNAILANDNSIDTLQNNVTQNSNATITNANSITDFHEGHSCLMAHTIFTSAGSNTILACCWYKNGLTLQDAATTCTFQGFHPISSNVNLNGGLLYLNTDLSFDSPTHLISSGKIWANNHTIELSKTTTVFAEGSYSTTINNGKLLAHYDLNLAGPLTFQGDCAFNCNGNAITLDSNASILVENNTTLTIKDATICGLSGSNIRCLNDTGKIIFNNVILKPTANCSFSNGCFEIL